MFYQNELGPLGKMGRIRILVIKTLLYMQYTATLVKFACNIQCTLYSVHNYCLQCTLYIYSTPKIRGIDEKSFPVNLVSSEKILTIITSDVRYLLLTQAYSFYFEPNVYYFYKNVCFLYSKPF